MQQQHLARLTFNVNMFHMGPSGKNEEGFNKLLNVVNLWKPLSILCMNGLDNKPNNHVQILKRTLQQWGGFLAYRPYEEHDNKLWKTHSAQNYVAFLKRFQCPDIWFAFDNEPDVDGNDDDWNGFDRWHKEVFEGLIAEGMCGIGYNFATGKLPVDRVRNGFLDDSLGVIAANANNTVNGIQRLIIGAHNYGHGLPPFHADGRNIYNLTDPAKVQKEFWPDQADIFDQDMDDNWLFFREWPMVERVCHIQTHVLKWEEPVLPQVYLTECNVDRLPNIEDGHKALTAEIDKIAGTKIFGVPTLKRYFQTMFPQWRSERTFCEIGWWQERVSPKNYLAFALFSWTFDNPVRYTWYDRFCVAEWVEFLDLWPKFVAEQRPLTPQVPLPPAEQPKPVTVDLLDYMRGDGRIYELFHTWEPQGVEVCRTENAPGNRFYLVKNANWEESLYDDENIYRAMDTSPGIEVIIHSDDEGKPAFWAKRKMTVGEQVERETTLTYRRAVDGVKGHTLKDFTWLKLHGVYAKHTFTSGLSVNDVIELHAMEGKDGDVFEKYWYAKGFGLVKWEDTTSSYSKFSYLHKLLPNAQPLARRPLAWYSPLENPFIDVPPATDPMPPIQSAAWKVGYLVLKQDDEIGVYSKARPDGDLLVAHIKSGALVAVAMDAEKDFFWPVQIGSTFGWVLKLQVEFKPLEVIAAPLPSVKLPDYKEGLDDRHKLALDFIDQYMIQFKHLNLSDSLFISLAHHLKSVLDKERALT